MGLNLFCAAAPGTIQETNAGARTATGTNQTTGTTISGFVAPGLSYAGVIPLKAGVFFFTEKGSALYLVHALLQRRRLNALALASEQIMNLFLRG